MSASECAPDVPERNRLGTLDLVFFEQRVLLIDFVAQRIAVTGRGEELPAAVARRFDFLPLEYRNYKLSIP
jgi:hypothetical protein